MKIESITVSYARTQSLSNYSNVKPHISLTAVIEEDDDFEEVQRSLLAECKAVVEGEIDNALEFDGESPKFFDGPLFQALRNPQRNCVLILPSAVSEPRERNWKTADEWYRVTGSPMRFETAYKAAVRASIEGDLILVNGATWDGSDWSRLPPLPDPGPEPTWHAKSLNFNQLRLKDESVWEELAQLEHVTADYLRRLYNNDAERKLSQEDLIALIRENQPWPPKGRKAVVAHDEDYEEEEDWDDDD
jgi:hypothetical protein